MTNIMLLAPAIGAAICISISTAWAGCQLRPIGQNERAYVDQLARRMKPLGVKEVDRVEQSDGSDHLIAIGAAFSLFVTPEDDLIHEIGFVLSEPAKKSEVEKMLTAVAFTLSSLSGQEETAIKNQLYDSVAGHGIGNWTERFGPAIAAFTRTGDGLVVKTGLMTCT